MGLVRIIEILFLLLGLFFLFLFFSVSVNPNLTYSSLGLTLLLLSGVLLLLNSIKKKFGLKSKGTVVMVAVATLVLLSAYAPVFQTAQYKLCNTKTLSCTDVVQVDSPTHYLFCVGAYYQIGGSTVVWFVFEVGCPRFGGPQGL